MDPVWRWHRCLSCLTPRLYRTTFHLHACSTRAGKKNDHYKAVIIVVSGFGGFLLGNCWLSCKINNDKILYEFEIGYRWSFQICRKKINGIYILLSDITSVNRLALHQVTALIFFKSFILHKKIYVYVVWFVNLCLSLTEECHFIDTPCNSGHLEGYMGFHGIFQSMENYQIVYPHIVSA